MTKEELKQALTEDNKTKVSKLLQQSNAREYQKTYPLIISSLSDLSFKEDKSDYQNALTLLDSIGYSAKSLEATLKGWNLFVQYGFTEDENDTTLPSHSATIDSNLIIENEPDEHISDDIANQSTCTDMATSGDSEEIFVMDL